MADAPNNQPPAYKPMFSKKPTGTGFTNLQSVLKANQGNRLGSAIGSGIQQTAQNTGLNIGAAGQQFLDQSNANRLDTDTNRQNISGILGRISNYQAPATPAPSTTTQTAPPVGSGIVAPSQVGQGPNAAPAPATPPPAAPGTGSTPTTQPPPIDVGAVGNTSPTGPMSSAPGAINAQGTGQGNVISTPETAPGNTTPGTGTQAISIAPPTPTPGPTDTSGTTGTPVAPTGTAAVTPTGDVAQSPLISADEQALFNKYRTGAYGGPTELANAQALRGQAADVNQLGQSVSSSQGRLGLLQRFAAKPGSQYGQGQQSLDQLLLGGATPDLQAARRQALGLSGQENQVESSAQALAKEYANRAQQFGTETQGAISAAQQPISGSLDQRVTAAKTLEQQRQQSYTDIKDLLAGRGLQDVKDPITGEITRKGVGPTNPNNPEAEANESRKQALTIAAQQGWLSADDINKIGDIGVETLTPIERMVTMQAQGGGDTGVLGYGGAQPGQSYQYSATPVTSGLNINELLQQYLTQNGATNIGRAGQATASDTARLNALSQLGGQTQEFTKAAPAYQQGISGWDLDKMKRTVDESVARLRNEKLVAAPTGVPELSMAERLKNSFTPTPEQYAAQQQSDLDKLTGATPTSAKDLFGAATRETYGTGATGVGGAIMSGIGNEALSGTDKLLHGDSTGDKLAGAAQLGGSLYTGAAGSAQAGVQNVASTANALSNSLNNLQNRGGIAGKIASPITAAPLAAVKAGNAIAQPVLGAAASGLGDISSITSGNSSAAQRMQGVNKLISAAPVVEGAQGLANLSTKVLNNLKTQPGVLGSAEKALATPAAAAAQVGADTVQDIGKALSTDTSLQGRQDAVNAALNAPANAVAKALGLQNAMGAISNIQNRITAPIVSAASGFAKGAGGVISKIADAINPFCYAEGTLIKMSDGNWKPVEKIEVGDNCFLGGEVLGKGESKVAQIYHYKDQLVSGSHAVFENGKWIRVEDTDSAEKYDNTLDIRVYPVYNKNHMVCTKTHIGSDFAELDEGATIPEKKRIEKLNQNKKVLTLLKEYDRIAYGNKDENS